MNKQERITVYMTLYLVVDCPHCGEDFNLNAPEFNEECQYTSGIFEGFDWRESIKGMEFECPECNKTFELDEISY